MSIRFHSIAARVLLIAAFAFGGASAFAQTPGTPWSSLTPDQQQVLESVHKNWDQLPPPAQQRLIRGAQIPVLELFACHDSRGGRRRVDLAVTARRGHLDVFAQPRRLVHCFRVGCRRRAFGRCR